MRRFECRNNPLGLCQQLAGVERLSIRNCHVLRPSTVGQPRVLWADRRIIKSRRNRMCQCDLPSFVLQDIRICPLQNARQSTAKSRCVITQFLSTTAGFDANELYFLISDELVKNSDGVRSAANARNDRS